MNRRNFLEVVAAGACLVPATGAVALAAADEPRTSMGVCQYSFSDSPHTKSAYDFVEYCHSLGAGGVQVGLDSSEPEYLDRLRRRTAELGMYFEAIVGLPKNNDPIGFERQVNAARQAGATCMRSACLNGRRYETFTSLAGWKQFVAESDQQIALALPVLEKHRIPLALENHKDWTADEMVALMERHHSEFLGVCLDAGNNIALLDDPMDVIVKLAPYAVSTHFKNMVVQEYPDGFLLSEVTLADGILDLRRAVEIIRKARPDIRLNLEMITRDPLKVPCLTDRYWTTFPERNGEYLARTMRLVRDHVPAKPVPHVSGMDEATRRQQEEDNVKRCLEYARDTLGLRIG